MKYPDNGIIIQARVGSSRLPSKMTRFFNSGKTLLEVILERFNQLKLGRKVIIATTTLPEDDRIAELADKNGFLIFRGSSEDVLQRFIDTAVQFELNGVIRVCADNPFIQKQFIEQLLDVFDPYSMDYQSWFINGLKPSILTHGGFFAEAVSVKALKKVKEMTSDPIYTEHVTNYIYRHPEKFRLSWIPFQDQLLDSIRLTIDTKDDFQLAQSIYKELKPDLDIGSVLSYIRTKPELLSQMKQLIDGNEK